jgi:hypothetical protein
LRSSLCAGDKFTFKVVRAAESQINFRDAAPSPLRTRVVNALTNAKHTLKLVANGDGQIVVDSFDVYQPPLLPTKLVPSAN